MSLKLGMMIASLILALAGMAAAPAHAGDRTKPGEFALDKERVPHDLSAQRAQPRSRFTIRLKVSGWIDYEGGRRTINMTPVDYNFQIVVPGAVKNYMLRIVQYTNGRKCAEGISAPGALNFPASTTMDIVPEFRRVFQGGSQVPASGNMIQVFVDPKICTGKEPKFPPPLTR